MTRREFLMSSAATGATLAAPSAFSGVFQDRPTLKVGLIGCGGRGTGAAVDNFNADPGTVLWAMGDLFKDRVDGSANNLKNDLKDRFKVTEDRKFHGFDAYKNVIDSGVDVVLMAAPPGFRPFHLIYAVEKGKHVFFEKPVATDAWGVREIMRAGEIAKSKGLSLVTGTQRRHDLGYNAVMERIHDGAIGDVVAASCYWNQGGLWSVPRQDGWSDMEWQCRNWLYFTWISGDIIVEQHIHNIDVCIWAKQAHPGKAISLGGRECRVDPVYGYVFDHFATEFEWADGSKMHSYCRQIDGTASNVSERIVGTKGVSDGGGNIRGENRFRYEGERPNPYVLEHKDLISAIRSGKPINEAQQIAETTLTAIMGRMAGYTGQEVTWDMALNSTDRLAPEKFEFGSMPVPHSAKPGTTPFK